MQGRDQQRCTGASGVLGGNARRCPGGAGGAEVQTHLALTEDPTSRWEEVRLQHQGRIQEGRRGARPPLTIACYLNSDKFVANFSR